MSSETGRAFLEEARRYLGEDYLPKIERCLGRLTDEQVWWRASERSNSVGNLLLHLEGNLRQWVVCGAGGAADARVRDREFAERRELPRAELLTALRATVEEAVEALARLDPTELLETRSVQGLDVTLLEAVFHAVEHFSMHTGQIIMLTKMLADEDLAFYDFSEGVPRADWGA
ncbi:MAG TPA: DinB family protein [Pyrinomonadaceae bacterium]|nr:DinB family protein [Pyrinomonadaceae bacterium]